MARFIGSEIYRTSTYGRQHPLAIPRVSATIDLVRALGWVDADDYVDSPRAEDAALARFHARDYLEVLHQAECDQHLPESLSRRYNIGRNGNPIFPEVFARPATACGATLLAARLLEAPGIVYSPAGGTHHGRPDRASGFCYLNDPVLGILSFLDTGASVLYVDLDAHHCDGVQDALAARRGVTIVSVHEDGRWPYTGAAEDRGGGNVFNLPVPAGFSDSELAFLMDEIVLPIAAAVRPDVLIVQTGCDALADDPLSKLALSNGALWAALARLKDMAPRLLVLGGGGYNPWAVARCWAGLWGVLTGRTAAARLPPAAEAVLRGLTWARSAGRNPPDRWFTMLADPPHDAPVRPAIQALASALAADLGALTRHNVSRVSPHT